MEANRLAEFRVRRREICLIVNSDDRRVGICSLRGACVAAALRAARREAQRILFKKSGLQNCDPPFLIFFYFLRQTEGIKDKQRHDLKTAEQHDGAHRELADAGEEAEVARRSHCAKARAHVADGRERGGERRGKVDVVKRQNQRAEQHDRDIGEEEDRNGRDGLLRHAMSVERDGAHLARVHHAPQISPQRLAQKHDARGLDAARRRARAATEKHHQHEDTAVSYTHLTLPTN